MTHLIVTHFRFDISFAYMHGNMFITCVSFARQHNFRLRTRERMMLTSLWLCFSQSLSIYTGIVYQKCPVSTWFCWLCISENGWWHAAPVGTYLICILYKSLISSPLCISGNKVLLSQYYGACRRSDVYFCVFSFLCCIYPRNCFRTSLHILLFKCKLWSLSTVKLWVWLRSNLWENSIFITF